MFTWPSIDRSGELGKIFTPSFLDEEELHFGEKYSILEKVFNSYSVSISCCRTWVLSWEAECRLAAMLALALCLSRLSKQLFYFQMQIKRKRTTQNLNVNLLLNPVLSNLMALIQTKWTKHRTLVSRAQSRPLSVRQLVC